MDKYIFLDIDGVLAVPETRFKLSSPHQYLLGEIIEATDAKLVISSSWRLPSVEETAVHMSNKGFLFCDRIVGVTIRAYHYIIKGVHLSIPRGVEIKQWIDTHIHSKGGKNWDYKYPGEDWNYVILDDDRDMLYEHKENFIHIDGEKGITKNNVDEAIKILNSRNFH